MSTLTQDQHIARARAHEAVRRGGRADHTAALAQLLDLDAVVAQLAAKWAPSADRPRDAEIAELRNFKLTIDPRTAHDSYASWRESDHDDLVLATALALWAGENAVGGPAHVWFA